MDLTEVGRERAELDAVLSSAIFQKAPNQSRLLRYLCERHFSRQAEQPKEHQIAIEALGRSDNFDERENSIVRVEAFRLRRKLQRYYDGEGSGHPLRIALDPGQYRVRFVETEGCCTEIVSQLPAEEVCVPEVVQSHAQGVGWRSIAVILLIVAVIGVIVAVALLLRRSRMTNAPAALSSGSGAFERATAVSPGAAIRILAGYDRPAHLDRLAQVWSGDRWFHGGEAVACPRQFLARTPDPTIYRHCRMGNFSYDIPLKPGVYELHLYFGPSVRPWTLLDESTQKYPIVLHINDEISVLNLNFASDGAVNTIPDVRVFRDIVPAHDGFLHLVFAQAGQYPFVNAIEIVPGIHGHTLPVRITASNYFYTDTHGNLWPPDRYYRGGTTVERRDEVSGTSDPDLFSSERYGNFDYLIPVAPRGTYAMTLGLAETWFGPKLPGGGGTESRRFNVSCNGAPLAKDLNVYAEAGGSDRALIRTFHNLHPDQDGKLRFTFTPSRNNAIINFMEIDEETAQTP